MRNLSRSNPANELVARDGLPDAAGYREALEVAAETFRLVEEYKTPPIPKAYEILYSYACSDREQVKVRVDEAIQRHGVLNLYDVDQIHADYFSYTEAVQARQDETARNMDAELDGMLSALTDQIASTGSYSRTLDMAAASLSNGVSTEQLKATVKLLVAENQRVREQSHQISGRLEQTRTAIETLKEELASVRDEGLRDVLTGLQNRRHFDRKLVEEIERASAEQAPLTLCIADIDHFSEVNDRFGHPTGDAVLRVIGSVMAENLKGRDTAVRYGGEEFAVILPLTELDAAKLVADRLREAISQKRLVLTASKESLGVITVSFGIAQLLPGESDAELIARAEAMLYNAKQTGRDRAVCDFDAMQG